MRVGLDRLASSGHIAPHEVEHLYEIIELVVGLQQRTVKASAVADQVRQIHERLVDLSATPVALTISSVAADSVTSNRENVAAADVGGCIGGANAGAIFGPWGVLIGAIVGGAAASIAEAYG